MRLPLLSAAVAAGCCLGTVAPASAEVVPTRDPMTIARALEDRPGFVTGAAFTNLPPVGNPAAVSTTRLGQFPSSGESFAVLSSGDASAVAEANDEPSRSADNGGTIVRGALDVTTLRLDFEVPAGLSCVTVGFRFYSEEFPEFVGREFNDAFIAELDESTWSSPPGRPAVAAPKNFAYDLHGNPINVNSVATTQVSRAQALGTTYDAATRRLRASTPVTPGPHSLYLTIFDQGDGIYDSAVLLDRLILDNLNPCTPGAAVDLNQPTPAGLVGLSNGRLSIPVSSVFLPERLDVTRISGTYDTTDPIRTRRDVPLRLRVRDTRDFLVRGARVSITTVPFGLLRPVAAKRTNRNGEVVLMLRPTPLLRGSARQNVVVFAQASKPGARADASVTGYSLITLRYAPVP